MRLALAQLDTVWHDPAANLEKARAMAERASKAGAKVLVLPEMFSTGFTMEPAGFAEEIPGPGTRAIGAIARQWGIWIIGTGIERHEPRSHNVAYAVGPNGALVAAYRKVHPFSFGKENEHFVGGTELVTFEIDRVKCSSAICYDLRFPELFRAMSGAGVELCFVPANWPTRRARHWSVLLEARAIENQMAVVGVNRVGKDVNVEYPGLSVAHDGKGEVLARGGADEELVIADLDIEALRAWREQFPALRDRRPEVYAALR